MYYTLCLRLILGLATGVVAISQSGLGGVGRGQQVRVEIPLGVECRPAAGRAVVNDRDVLVTCPAAEGPPISCDGVGLEPRDFAVADLCRGARIDLFKSQVLSVESASDVNVVKWVEIDDTLGIHTLAERRDGWSGRHTLNVARGRGRLLQFQRSGAPLTVLSTLLPARETWLLPSAADGGELAVWVRSGSILPASVELIGSVRQVAEMTDGFGRLAGLPEGDYRYVLRFTGGLSAAPVPVRIKGGESVVIALPSPPVGGVEISSDLRTCANTNEILISRREVRSVGDLVTQVLRVPHGGDCSRRVAGLRPGRYEIKMGSDGLSFLTQVVDVREQDWSQAAFESQPVNVRGVVSWNGQPLPGQLVEFSLSSSSVLSAPTARAVVRPTGDFEVELPQAGRYRVGLSKSGQRSIGETRLAEFREGSNTFNWAASGGLIRVDLAGWDRSSDVSVTVRRISLPPSGGAIEQTTYRIAPSERLPFDIGGLSQGEFLISASQRDAQGGFKGKVSQVASVGVSERQPDQAVVLTLLNNTAEVLVVTPDREIVFDASIVGGRVERDPQSGVFALSGTSPGTRLMVSAPGFVPTCVPAPSSGRLTVVVSRGRSVTVDLPSVRDPFLYGFVQWAPGQCPVAIGAFSPKVISSNEGRVVVGLSNFPLLNQLLFADAVTFASPVALSVGEGVIRMPVKR